MKAKSIARRTFLRQAGSGCGAMVLSSILSPSLVMAQSSTSGGGKNVILINLAGGLDGLQLCPYREGILFDTARALRPSIYPTGILPAFGGSPIGMNPALAAIADVVRENGKIIQKYGIIADPGRSHDACQLLMDLGVSRSSVASKGFVAKFADAQNLGLFQYWGLQGSSGYFSFNADQAVPIVTQDLESFGYRDLWNVSDEYDQQYINETRRALVEMELPQDALAERLVRPQRVMHQAVMRMRSDIAVQQVGLNERGNYTSSSIGKGLSDAARILKAKATVPMLGVADKLTVMYLTQGGFDHHSSIADPTFELNFNVQIASLAENLAVFVQDLKNFTLWDRTTIVLFSEFGRTNRQNGTLGDPTVGTDHGWGSHTIVLGGAIVGGVLGESATVGELQNEERDALIPTIDYRDIFGDVIQHVGGDVGAVFDEPGYSYRPLGIYT